MNTKSQSDGLPVYVTGDQLGQVLGVSGRRVRQLVAEKTLPPAGAEGYPLAASVQAILAKAREAPEVSPATKNRARLIAARAEQAEQAIAIRNGELAPVDNVMAHVSTIAAEIVELLNGLPARVTRDLDQRAKIRREVDAIRREISEKIARNVALARARCA